MKRNWLWLAAATFLLAGSFFLGIGTAGYLDQKSGGRMAPFPKTGSADECFFTGTEENPYDRDRRNALLAQNMQYVSMEREVFFENGEAFGYAGIANEKENRLGCRIMLIRDGTGERIYQSDLIDPGHYIEKIRLRIRLRKGYYPCTAFWSFYEQTSDQLVGNMAGKVVVIVNQ